MNKIPAYTITQESVCVIWEGKPRVVKRGSLNYPGLRDALIQENWDAVPNFLSSGKALQDWLKGAFTLKGDHLFHDGELVPDELYVRILELANEGEDPNVILNFWERLKRNPSYRSVTQLWTFLKHKNIPLTDDGCFFAYKGVRADYKDIHSGKFDNHPGAVHEMPRNQISDDPNHACHEGFHVGSLNYARGFMGSDGQLVVCKVDPEHVVCVPFDSNAEKMRVCKYEVIGNYGSALPDTVFSIRDIAVGPNVSSFDEEDDDDWDDDDDADTPPDENEDADSGHDDDDEDDESEDSEDGTIQAKTFLVNAGAKTRHKKVKLVRGFIRLSKMDPTELLNEPIEELRRYAGKGMKIIGASKIPGGKIALIQRILQVRE